MLFKLNVKGFADKTPEERDKFVNCLTSSIEKVTVSVFAIVNLVTIKSPDGKYFGWVHSNITFFEPQPAHGYVMSISLGYLIFDEIAMRTLWANPWVDKLTVQMSAHHYIVAVFFISAFGTGYALATIVNVGLICEISTLFANLVELVDAKEGCLFRLIQFCFFVTYTAMRIIFFPYGMTLGVIAAVGIWPKLVIMRRVSFIVHAIVGFLIQCLMFYWFYFIIKKLMRLLGCSKRQPSHADATGDDYQELMMDHEKKQLEKEREGAVAAAVDHEAGDNYEKVEQENS